MSELFRNIHLTGDQGACSQWPNQIGAAVNADWPTAKAAGWRKCPQEPTLAEGYSRQHIMLVEGDGEYGQWQVVDRSIAEMEAEEDAARQASLVPLMGKAHLFRVLLRRHFGDGAETNRNITADAVTAYFATATGLSGDDVRDGVLLKDLFTELAAWTGTGETWTLFETYGGLIP